MIDDALGELLIAVYRTLRAENERGMELALIDTSAYQMVRLRSRKDASCDRPSFRLVIRPSRGGMVVSYRQSGRYAEPPARLTLPLEDDELELVILRTVRDCLETERKRLMDDREGRE